MASQQPTSSVNGPYPQPPHRFAQRLSHEITHDSSEEDDNSDPDDRSEAGFDDLKSGRHYLGLSRAYVPSWRKYEAFREFYQNWSEHLLYLYRAFQVTNLV